MSFEEQMKRLEEIVRALEKGDVSLDDSMQLFEEGTALIGQCQKKLEEAEQKVQIMVSQNLRGEPVLSPMEGESK